MKNITFYSVPDEVNTLEKTIAWLQKKFRNDEKFQIRIVEHTPFEVKSYEKDERNDNRDTQ